MAKTTVEFIREIGGQVTQGGKQPARRALAVKLWNLALDGDLRAARLILDYDVVDEGQSPVVIEAELLRKMERVYGQVLDTGTDP